MKSTVQLTVKSCFIKIKEALDAFFKENVVPNTMAFDSITDKINYLIEHNYIETAFIQKYRPEFFGRIGPIYQKPKLPIQVLHGCL